MFYSTKNRNRDIVRRIRQKGKSFGSSPGRKRKMKKYNNSKRRSGIKRGTRKAVQQECSTDFNSTQDVDNRFHENVAATRLQCIFRRAQLKTRISARRVNALRVQVQSLPALEMDIRSLLDFVNSPFAHIVDCSALNDQREFLYHRLVEVNFSPVPSVVEKALGQLWDASIRLANRNLSMLSSIQSRVARLVETRSCHSNIVEKIHSAQAKMIVEREKTIESMGRAVRRYKTVITRLIEMIPDPEEEPPAFDEIALLEEGARAWGRFL